MILTERQTKLLGFVISEHGDQKRKYTGEPYWEHPYAVAKIAIKYDFDAIEPALCHDLFEDTSCDFNALYKALESFGYDGREAYKICTTVKELTDVFTTEDFPYYNRDKRKGLENSRMQNISNLAQTIKYADLIDNTASIIQHDAGFAKVYLKEKENLLKLMDKGNTKLYSLCCVTVNGINSELDEN